MSFFAASLILDVSWSIAFLCSHLKSLFLLTLGQKEASHQINSTRVLRVSQTFSMSVLTPLFLFLRWRTYGLCVFSQSCKANPDSGSLPFIFPKAVSWSGQDCPSSSSVESSQLLISMCCIQECAYCCWCLVWTIAWGVWIASSWMCVWNAGGDFWLTWAGPVSSWVGLLVESVSKWIRYVAGCCDLHIGCCEPSSLFTTSRCPQTV